MRNRTTSLVPAVILTLASLGSSIPISYARSGSSFGPAVDAACQDFNGTAPYSQQTCALCHNMSNTSQRLEPQWSWWETGNLTAFCPPTANQAPNARIDAPATNQTINVGESVNFAGSATDPDGDPIASFSWNFGGGAQNSNQQNPGNVQFNTAGTFTVILAVTDSRGMSDPSPATRTVTVQTEGPANQAPNGTIGNPALDLTIDVGQSVNFMGSGVDPDGQIASYLWNFGGGAPNSTEQNPGSVQFNIPGIFDVTLTVTDDLGMSDPTPDSRRITVNATGTATCTDADGDGFARDGGFCGPEDCDDTDRRINPGATEICADGVDNDCDFYIDETDSECLGGDCIGRLFGNSDAGHSIQLSDEADRDPAGPLDGSLVSGGIYVFVAPTPGINRVTFFLDDVLAQTENYAPWDFAGGSSDAANALDTTTLSNGSHSIRAVIQLESGETVTISAGFTVDNGEPDTGEPLTIDIRRAVWDAREQELKVEGIWPTLGARVTVSNAITGAVLGVTVVERDDGELAWEFERERPATVPCRVRVEIEGQFGERDVTNAPADCDGSAPPAPVNRQPTANDDAAATDEDTPVTVNVLANDGDPDGDALSLASVTQGGQGSVEIVGSSLRFTPNANFAGVDSFTYTVSDGNGGTDTARVELTIRPVNDTPIAVDDTATTDAGVTVVVDVLANDSDVDGDPLNVAAVGDPAHGNVNNLGTLIGYTPDSGFSGADSFSYTVSDGNGGTTTATVSVTVRAPTPSLELDIESATWSRFRRLLTVEGEDAPPGSAVTLFNASTLTLLGNATAEDDGDWEIRVASPSPVPCRVRVEVRNGGQIGFAERDVRRAPRDCR